MNTHRIVGPLLCAAAVLLGLFALTSYASAADDPEPEPKKTNTHIDIVSPGDHTKKMSWSGGPGSVTLTAQATIGGVKYEASIEVKSGEKTPGEAAEELADALKEELPEDLQDNVCPGGTTIIVKCTDPGVGPGDDVNEHQHPNVTDAQGKKKVVKSYPRSTQFSTNK